MTKATRHILGLSGGKDSSALAVYMKDRVPEMEYVFCDTQKELPETYEYIDKLEAFLGKPIARLNPERGFDHWLKVYSNYLPSSQMRWCTRQLKLKPFEQYVGEDPVISYVGIRADEDRDGYISTKPNIKAVFPFKEDGITKADVFRLLQEAGLGTAVLLQLADAIWLLLLLLPAEERMGGATEAPPGPLRGIQEVREGRSR